MKVLKFGAIWCPPCKVMKTTLHGFDECELQEIDVDKETDITSEYGVRSLPTLVLLNDDGEEIWRKTGVTSKMELTSVVKSKRGN